MADAFAQFNLLIREQAADSVVNVKLDTDDVIWDLMGTFDATDNAGRDTSNALASGDAGWFAEWRMWVQRGGLVTGGTFNGNTLAQMGADDTLFTGQAADAVYPDPALAPARSYETIRMQLKRIQGIYTVNRQQILADLATKPIVDLSSGAVEDIVFLNRALIEAYIYGAGNATVAQVDNAAGYTLTKGTNTKVTVKTGTAYRFVIGQRYVAGTNADPRVTAGGTAANPEVFRCVDIDTDTRQPVFEPEPDTASTIGLTDSDHIMVHGTYDFTAATVALGTRAANGFESLLINTGNFPGALKPDVTKHSHLKSYVKGDEDNLVAPTPEVIAELIDKITDSGEIPPNACISEASLWTYYAQIERAAGATYPVPQGAAFTASGGVAGPRLSHGPVTFARLTSSKVRPGSILGISPDTFKRFMPLGDKTIHWALTGGGMAGTDSIFGPIYTGRQLTEMSAAPFDSFVEFGCEKPRRNFRRIGLYSQRSAGGT